MTAYLVVRVDVQDWDKYREYMRHTPRVIAQYGGRFIARGGELETLEGEVQSERVVLLEFPSRAAARDFYRSPEYQAAKQLRAGGGAAQFVLIDGYPEADWDAAVAASRSLSLPT
ncbi:MAG: DUF1330 domain-containing protein [Pseudomonadota bacterium]